MSSHFLGSFFVSILVSVYYTWAVEKLLPGLLNTCSGYFTLCTQCITVWVYQVAISLLLFSIFFATYLHTFMLLSWLTYQTVAHSICFLMTCFIMQHMFLLTNCKLKSTSTDQQDSQNVQHKMLIGWYFHVCHINTFTTPSKQSLRNVFFYKSTYELNKSYPFDGMFSKPTWTTSHPQGLIEKWKL